MNQGSEAQCRDVAARVGTVRHKLSFLDTGAHRVALGSAPSALPGNLWEIQNLSPCPVPADPETSTVVPGSCVFTDCPGGVCPEWSQSESWADPVRSKLSVGMGRGGGQVGEVHAPPQYQP